MDIPADHPKNGANSGSTKLFPSSAGMTPAGRAERGTQGILLVWRAACESSGVRLVYALITEELFRAVIGVIGGDRFFKTIL
jgi:hypothetical protein